MNQVWWITHVKWRDDRKLIEWYWCSPVAAGKPGKGKWMGRHDLAKQIVAGDEFYTARPDAKGNLTQRAHVEIRISTDPDASRDDNLENLPEAK